MDYQFDRVIERKHTLSRKWDGVPEVFGDDQLIPMWIADMDFKPPEAVVEAVTTRAAHGIYGYEQKPEDYLQIVLNWLKRRHDWLVDPAWLIHSPGVVPGLALSVLTLTKAGERIVIQPPVYPPFYAVTGDNQRNIVENPLVMENGKYRMNFTELEQIFQSGVKFLIFCSPHNPVGRVWERQELERLAELVLKYRVTVLSDEIWADLAFKGHKHIPLASLNPELAEQTLTFVAASKTFNIAGLYLSNIIIPNRAIREKLEAELNRLALNYLNLFGLVASTAAFRHGEKWLDSLLGYLEANADYAISQLHRITPKIEITRPEGTFVLWLDCRGLGIPPEQLNRFFSTKAGIGLNDGIAFGKVGLGFQRMNIGCPRPVLQEALKRLSIALKDI